MLRERSVHSPARVIPRFSLKRRHRAVRVSVFICGHEVDAFEVSQPETLRAALRPVYAFLPAGRGEVRFQAVTDEWLPFGIARTRREVTLAGPGEALAHIAA